MTTLYIAGPMTGLPEYNYPAFAAASTQLMLAGYEVFSPHRIDSTQGTQPGSQSWDWYMRHALRLLVGADAVALLPGWQDSKGARLEAHVAECLGMRMRSVDEWLRVAR